MQLPEFTERLPPGLKGKQELERLLHVLLEVYASSQGTRYHRRDTGSPAGIDGWLDNSTHKEMEGTVAFSFAAHAPDLRLPEDLAANLHNAMHSKRLLLPDQNIHGTGKGPQHFVLLTPVAIHDAMRPSR